MRRQQLLSVVWLMLQRPARLSTVAARAGWTPFHLHRALRTLLGEPPARYRLRLSLEGAAARLLASERPVRRIATDSGFRSHEVFSRAFRRQFGTSPQAYRARSRRLPGASRTVWRRHLEVAGVAGPCLGLFHVTSEPQRSLRFMTSAITIVRNEYPQQPLLGIQRRIAHSELAAMLSECFGTLFAHGHKQGLPIAGAPLARYVSMGPGLWTVEAAMPLASAAQAVGEMQPGILPAGPAAFAVHHGPYDKLPETHAAVERWIEAHGYTVGGAPWESYVTDPGQVPDPAQWRTEVFWPLTPAAPRSR